MGNYIIDLDNYDYFKKYENIDLNLYGLIYDNLKSNYHHHNDIDDYMDFIDDLITFCQDIYHIYIHSNKDYCNDDGSNVDNSESKTESNTDVKSEPNFQYYVMVLKINCYM